MQLSHEGVGMTLHSWKKSEVPRVYVPTQNCFLTWQVLFFESKEPLGLENKSPDPSLVLNSKMKQDPKVNSLSFFFF